MKDKKKIYAMITEGERVFYGIVILVDTAAYTMSFLISGLVKKDIFNVLEGQRTTLGIYSLKMLILLNVIMPLVINCVKQMNSFLVARVRMRFTKNVKAGLLQNFMSEKMGDGKDWGYGETVSLFRNECEDVVSYLLEYYYQLPKIVLCIAILIVMFWINPYFSVISLIPTFGMTRLIKYMDNRIVAYRKSARQSAGNVTEFLENCLGNAEYFKLSVGSRRLKEIFREKCRQRSEKERKDRVLDKTLSVISENSSNFVLGIILLIAIPLYFAGNFSVGEFVMFEYYYVFLAALPDAAGCLIRRHRQSGVAVNRIFRKLQISYNGSAVFENGVLQIKVECPKEAAALEARKGEVILIAGGSESDRSLILQRMFQVCKDCMGKAAVSYVPQEPVLFEETIRENICFGSDYDENAFREVINAVDLAEDIRGFSDGINRNVGKMGGAVSGGQRKRIGLARALYDNGDVLFIDGLSEAVDEKTEKILVSNILGETDKIVFVASDSESVRKMAAQIVLV